MLITVLDLAKFRGLKEDENGKVSMGAFDDVGLPLSMQDLDGVNKLFKLEII